MTRDRSTPADGVPVSSVLAPGEQVVRVTPATPAMTWSGLVAWGYAVPVAAIGWFPFHKAMRHWGGIGLDLRDRAPLLLFGGFGTLWLLLAAVLLYQPIRLSRRWPHVYHVLTDRRFVEVDRRKGVTAAIVLRDIWTLSVFTPFGRLRCTRRGASNGSVAGRNATSPSFDGVGDVAALAQMIADRTGVAVGLTRAEVDASIARMPPGTTLR